MPRPARTLCAGAAALAACALGAPALAVFTGIDLREDKGQIPPVELAQIDPLGQGVRVINLYATFDGPGSWTPEFPRSENTIITVLSTEDRQPGVRWEIDKTDGKHADAGFYDDPLGGIRAPQEALVDLFPSVAWDSYVSVGLKTIPTGVSDVTNPLPSFEFSDQDGDGLNDGIDGAWSISNPEVEQHVAIFNPDSGQNEVFLTQLTIIGLDPGAELGALRPGVNGMGRHEWETSIFSGDLEFHTQLPLGGFERFYVDFVPIPAPATSLTILPLFLTISRRRRSAC